MQQNQGNGLERPLEIVQVRVGDGLQSLNKKGFVVENKEHFRRPRNLK